MKKVALLLALANLSSTAYAVEGGQDVNWQDYPYLVESQCTGTVLAGKYVLLAGHCGASVSSPFPRMVNLSNQTDVMPISRNAELFEKTDDDFVDIALWTLPQSVPTDKVAFVADLNAPETKVELGDKISYLGFGRDNNIPKLGKAINTIMRISSPDLSGNARFDYSGVAHSVPGDSGAPVFNKNNRIVGINVADNGKTDDGIKISSGERLRKAKDWLLTNIDAWHSPTELTFTGDKTLEIQSLHMNPTNLAERQNNGTLTTGDVSVTGGTCLTDTIEPFGICTLEMKSGQYEGHITLDDGNEITINRGKKPTPPNPDPDGKDKDGGSGGSIGWLGLLGLLVFAFKRK
ncbi:trypsin-like serine protease [Photobacterium leiognathi]|uniref:trypsin-like serine protease n=1 Tax=Photobacterium leiognathi TaxID=553611 RepID=UPI002981BD8B|nr:trypsin-like serine protease [Photobacterium leiognathi]